MIGTFRVDPDPRAQEWLRTHAADADRVIVYDVKRLLVDRRAARRLPSRFGLTVRGVGPFRRLDLDLSGEEWGALLYD
jgi:hypothetical protein